MLFAKRLLTMDLMRSALRSGCARSPKSGSTVARRRDALAFAIYATDGTMILNDGETAATSRITIAAMGLMTAGSKTTTMTGVFMAVLAGREVPRGRSGVGIPAGDGAGCGQLAADAVAEWRYR